MGTTNRRGAGWPLCVAMVGMTNDGFRRRSLLGFDVAGSIPAGSTINSVTLNLTIDRGRIRPSRWNWHIAMSHLLAHRMASLTAPMF